MRLLLAATVIFAVPAAAWVAGFRAGVERWLGTERIEPGATKGMAIVRQLFFLACAVLVVVETVLATAHARNGTLGDAGLLPSMAFLLWLVFVSQLTAVPLFFAGVRAGARLIGRGPA